MKITSRPGNGNKIHISLDGKYAFTLYDDYWYRLGIAEGEEITEEELAPLKEEAGFRSAYEKGLRYLSTRAYGEKELTVKLSEKFGGDAAARAVKKLAGYGYIDDEKFAEEYARYLYEKKQYDIRRISAELKMKGIGAEFIDNALKTLDNEPIQRIIIMLSTKFEKNLSDDKSKKRLVNRLLRMGYSFSDIKSAFAEVGADMPALY